MLGKALAAKERAIGAYRERIRQAEAIGDTELKITLENQVADETRHKEQIQRILVGWDGLEDKRKIDARWQDEGGQG
jgi:bacterioferritin